MKTIFKDNYSTDEAAISWILAKVYSDEDIIDQAEIFFRKTLTLEHEVPEIMNFLAYLLIDSDRDINEGLPLADKALELSCGAVCSEPTRLFRNLRTEMDPPGRFRFRSDGINPIELSPPVASCTTGVAMECSHADDLGCQWATVRLVTHDTPDAAWSQLAGDGNPDTGYCRWCGHPLISSA